jgi:methylmalonyl-CoA/ethylmalonyl-CoA epimerase
MDKIEHIGIAVRSLIEARPLYETLLGCKSYKTEEVSSENVITEFFKIGDSKIELLEASSTESAIASFIEKRGEGVHHIAFAVENIVEEMARLKAEGFELLNEVPKIGADNKLVCFIHPKSAHGVLIELCQEIK